MTIIVYLQYNKEKKQWEGLSSSRSVCVTSSSKDGALHKIKSYMLFSAAKWKEIPDSLSFEIIEEL